VLIKKAASDSEAAFLFYEPPAKAGGYGIQVGGLYWYSVALDFLLYHQLKQVVTEYRLRGDFIQIKRSRETTLVIDWYRYFVALGFSRG
jgi:hypothetical protein